MAKIGVQEITLAGLTDLSFVTAEAAGDSVENDGRTVVVVKNGSGSGKTVTLDRKKQAFGKDVDPDPVTVPAGGEAYIGPLPRDEFTSLAEWTYDDVTSVTVAAVRLTGVVPV